MTSEPPSTTRRNRPDAGFRRRALVLPPSPAGPAPSPEAEAPERESFKDTLARIPDLEVEAPVRAAAQTVRAPVEAAPSARPAPGRTKPVRTKTRAAALATGTATSTPVAEPATASGANDIWDLSSPTGTPAVDHDLDEVLPGGDAVATRPDRATTRRRPGGGRARRVTSTPPPAPTWRRVAFGVVLVALVVSIPLLGRTGYRLVTESTDGTEGNSGAAPGEPGYEELVTSTPTAVVLQTDAEGKLAGLTFLALGSEGGGGTVVFLPLETIVRPAGFGIDSLRSAYEVGNRKADDAAAAAGVITGQILNVGIDEVIQLDDRSWAEEVRPVAPLAIDNLDPVTVAGFPLPAGPLELSAEATGPYLAAIQEGESELGLLARQEQVWRSWLAQVAAAPNPDDAVPGSGQTGLGRFVRTLAAGEVAFTTLPTTVVPAAGFEPEMFDPDTEAVKALVADAVPAPDPSLVGSRRSFRLLNGVAPERIPLDLIRQVTSIEGSVVVIGNGPSFDFERTTITYNDPAQETYANRVKAEIGATGEVVLDREAPDEIDITVVYGRDLLQPQAVPSSTTTAAGAAPVDPSLTPTQPGGP